MLLHAAKRFFLLRKSVLCAKIQKEEYSKQCCKDTKYIPHMKDADPRLRETTYANKRYLFDRKVLPYFGEMPISAIKPTDIRNWQNELINYERSVNQALIHSLIKCETNIDPKLVWSRIAEKCSYWKQAAATVTGASIPSDISELFGPAKTAEASMTISPEFSPTTTWAIAALIGTWSEKNASDISAIERLSSTSYEAFRSECRQYLNTGMLDLVNGQWNVVNRTAVMEAVRDLYFDNTIQTAFQLANEYLSENSKQFDDHGVFNLLIPASGRFSNTDGFRKGLLEGLCLITNGRKPSHCSDHLIKTESMRLVSNILKNCTWVRLVSLSNLILLLGELCPSAYLGELEKSIHNIRMRCLPGQITGIWTVSIKKDQRKAPIRN